MKRKFSLSGNLELKFCWKIYTKITKVIPKAFLGDFLLKIGINWNRDIRKDVPFYNYEGPPLATPTTQHHRIMRFYENAWLGFRYCTFLDIFCVPWHANLLGNFPNGPILTILNYIKLVYGFLNTPLCM